MPGANFTPRLFRSSANQISPSRCRSGVHRLPRLLACSSKVRQHLLVSSGGRILEYGQGHIPSLLSCSRLEQFSHLEDFATMSDAQVGTLAPANLNEAEKTHTYDGKGTPEDPFVVEFVRNDVSNPMNWSSFRKWFITSIVTLSVFAVTFTSSAYAQSYNEVIAEFNISKEIFIVGVSLFVLGFAIGPVLWGGLVSSIFLLSC